MPAKRMRWDELASRAPGAEHGVEIGVWRGSMSGRLLQLIPSLTLEMVDRWAPPDPGETYCDTDDCSRLGQEGHNAAYARARAIARRYGKRARITRMDSVSAAAHLGSAFDFAFVDGDHTQEGVWKDLEAWAPKVKHGGLLCGHDYGHSRAPGVALAADRWAWEHGLELEVGEDFTFFVRMS